MRIGTVLIIPLAFASFASATVDYYYPAYSGDTTMQIDGGNQGLVVNNSSNEAIYGDGYYHGVHGNSSSGLGVWGESNSNTGVYGLGGFIGVAADGDWGYGVKATANSGIAVDGYSTSSMGGNFTGYDNGLTGQNTNIVQNTTGVKGIAGIGTAGAGHGLNGQGLIGVSGYSGGTVNNTYGVYGNANGTGNYYSSYGIFGTAANGSTNWSGYFTGNVYVGGTFVNPSDIKFKKNIQPLNGGLEKVMALHPKTYDMKVDEFKGKVMLPEGNRYGLIAQELETVLPDLVHKVSAPAELPKPGSPEAKNYVQQPNTDFKSVDYISLIPILIAAIQDQQAEIEALKKAR